MFRYRLYLISLALTSQCKTDEVIATPEKDIKAEDIDEKDVDEENIEVDDIPLPIELSKSQFLHPYTSIVVSELSSICKRLKDQCSDVALLGVDKYLGELKKYSSEINETASREQLNKLLLVSDMGRVFQELEAAIYKGICPKEAHKIQNTLQICKVILECAEELKSGKARISGKIIGKFAKFGKIKTFLVNKNRDYYGFSNKEKELMEINFNGSEHLNCLLKIYNADPASLVFNNNLELIELLISIKYRTIKNCDTDNLNEQFLREIYLLFLYELKVHFYACAQLHRLVSRFYQELNNKGLPFPKMTKNISFLHDFRALVINNRHLIPEISDKILKYISQIVADINDGYNSSACINDNSIKRIWCSTCQPYQKDKVFENIYYEAVKRFTGGGSP